MTPAGQNGTFRPLGNGPRRLHGRTALLAGGFQPDGQSRLLALLAGSGLGHIPVVFLSDTMAEASLGELAALPGNTGFGQPCTAFSCMVMSGLLETELHTLMRACREAGLAPRTWACVTPTSESWSARRLFEELRSEREALKKAVAGKG